MPALDEGFHSHLLGWLLLVRIHLAEEPVVAIAVNADFHVLPPVENQSKFRFTIVSLLSYTIYNAFQ